MTTTRLAIAKEQQEHLEHAARLLRGYIRALTAMGVPLVLEWQEWVDRDKAFTPSPKRKRRVCQEG